jgi:cytochrome c biogenesis protein CcmG, thiol:disulfide interchange protein DsbE
MNRETLAARLQMVAIALIATLAYPIWEAGREVNVSVGDTAPNFQLTTDRGKEMSRNAFGGKVLVLNFWATWCPPCIDELPSLQTMAAQLGPKGVVVLGVSVDTNEAAYQQFLKRARISFETSRDPEADISAEYGTFKYPETYVIDREGKVVQKHIGPRDWMDPQIVKGIEALL